MVKYVASLHILQEEVNTQIILEDVLHGKNERVLRLEQDILLRFGVNNLPLLNEDILVDPLHRELAARLRVNNEEHLAEGALVDHLLDLEIFQFHLVWVHFVVDGLV